MPLRLTSTRPASRSLPMWWEMVGWLRSRAAVKSQMQTGPRAFQSAASIVRRVGSPSAFKSSDVDSAQPGSTSGSPQQTPRSLITGNSLSFTEAILRQSIRVVRWIVLGLTHRRNSIGRRAAMSKVEEAVRSRYASTARQLEVVPPVDCCSGDASCECDCGGPYSAEELGEVGMTGAMSLGCGNPTLLARLEPGQVVLDLGSGAGLDVLLSARRVAPGGHAYGVDMTDEMLAVAERNRERAGISNASFLKGTIEEVPLPDASVDVVISNCVINLAEDKAAVIG